jgi:CheY-like chemotaxis protein
MPTPATTPDRPAPLSILLVDDHRDGGDSCAELLRLLGYVVRVARNCAEALAVVGSFAPDVAVLDIGLPDGDGYQLAERLVAALTRRPLLVALTGFNHFEGRSEKAGFDHHFLKPVDPTVLSDLLARHARRAGS